VGKKFLQVVPMFRQVVSNQCIIRGRRWAMHQVQTDPGTKLGWLVNNVILLKTMKLLDRFVILALSKVMVASAPTIANFIVDKISTDVKIFTTDPILAQVCIHRVVRCAE
jgi:hypothetical protein